MERKKLKISKKQKDALLYAIIISTWSILKHRQQVTYIKFQSKCRVRERGSYVYYVHLTVMEDRLNAQMNFLGTLQVQLFRTHLRLKNKTIFKTWKLPTCEFKMYPVFLNDPVFLYYLFIYLISISISCSLLLVSLLSLFCTSLLN